MGDFKLSYKICRQNVKKSVKKVGSHMDIPRLFLNVVIPVELVYPEESICLRSLERDQTRIVSISTGFSRFFLSPAPRCAELWMGWGWPLAVAEVWPRNVIAWTQFCQIYCSHSNASRLPFTWKWGSMTSTNTTECPVWTIGISRVHILSCFCWLSCIFRWGFFSTIAKWGKYSIPSAWDS